MDSNTPHQPLLTHASEHDYHAPPSDHLHHPQQHPYPPPIVELEQNNPPKQNNPYQNPYMTEHNFPSQPHGAAYYQPQIIIPIPDYLEGLPTSAEGRLPQRFYCVMCKKPQVSRVHHKMGTGSWVCTLALFLVICPASVLPCCCNGCQDAVHTCPDCRRQVGKDRFCGISSYCFTSAKYTCTSCHRTFHQLKLSSLQPECPRCGSLAYEVPEDPLPEPQRATSMTPDDVIIEDETPSGGSWEDIPDEMEEERPVEGSSMNTEAPENPQNPQNNAENTQMSPFVIIVRGNMVFLLIDPTALSAFGVDVNSAGLQDYGALLEAFLNNDPNKYGPAPAEEESIKKLEEVNYCAGNEKCVFCTVCQEEYQAEEKLVRLPCEHYYHKDCVVEWLSRHNACPMCRKAI